MPITLSSTWRTRLPGPRPCALPRGRQAPEPVAQPQGPEPVAQPQGPEPVAQPQGPEPEPLLAQEPKQPVAFSVLWAHWQRPTPLSQPSSGPPPPSWPLASGCLSF